MLSTITLNYAIMFLVIYLFLTQPVSKIKTFIRYYTVPYILPIWFGLSYTYNNRQSGGRYCKKLVENSQIKEEEDQLNKLQRIILDRTHERKKKVHKLHSIVYNDNLWLQIQTLEWVLSEIRSIKRRRMSSASTVQINQQQKDITAKINSLMLSGQLSSSIVLNKNNNNNITGYTLSRCTLVAQEIAINNILRLKGEGLKISERPTKTC